MERTQQYTRNSLSKIDKSQYTKEEYRALKLSLKEQNIETEYSVLCLKHGDKYNALYVNTLFNMVTRHCTLPFKFYCLTDDPTGLNPTINVIKLPSHLRGWWCKPYMYSNDLPIEGTILYFDLDVVIASNIDKLFTFSASNWCTIRDFTRVMRPGWQKYNSSIVRFKKGQLHKVWEDFDQNHRTIIRQMHGDQDWLYKSTTENNLPAVLYPDKWIQSWKWEIRRTKDWAPNGRQGTRMFARIEDCKPKEDCCVCVFHGDPNPHNCLDPWVVENWK